jgi:magnesium transporter
MLEIFVYRKKEKTLEKILSVNDLPQLLKDSNNLIWIDMEEPNKEEEKILSEVFNFHPLTIEDAIETRNYPKVEAFSDYLFFIFHGIKNETNSYNFVTKELDGYLGRNFLVTYHHEKFRSIEEVKKQIGCPIFQKGVDYLLHQILDRMIDSYIPVIEDFEKTISYLEYRILSMQSTNKEILEEIMKLKRSIARLIRIGSKQERVLYRISHGEFLLIDESNLPFYRDVYDHLLRVVVLAENYRDLVNGLLNIHFNVLASKTNEAIKLMTVISTIMLPLSLIAGIYGMNFEYMPELKVKYAYFVVLAVMFLIAMLLILYFWWKGWIFEKKD